MNTREYLSIFLHGRISEVCLLPETRTGDALGFCRQVIPSLPGSGWRDLFWWFVVERTKDIFPRNFMPDWNKFCSVSSFVCLSFPKIQFLGFRASHGAPGEAASGRTAALAVAGAAFAALTASGRKAGWNSKTIFVGSMKAKTVWATVALPKTEALFFLYRKRSHDLLALAWRSKGNIRHVCMLREALGSIKPQLVRHGMAFAEKYHPQRYFLMFCLGNTMNILDLVHKSNCR